MCQNPAKVYSFKKYANIYVINFLSIESTNKHEFNSLSLIALLFRKLFVPRIDNSLEICEVKGYMILCME